MTTRRSPFVVVCLTLLLSASALAWANEVDEAGNWIATPREAEMMEKGFLYFPPRVIRKPGAVKPVEAKPVEAKSAEAKPIDAKPLDAKPPLTPVTVAEVSHTEVAQVQALETVPASPTPTVVSDPSAVPVMVADPNPPAPAAAPASPEVAGQKILQTNPKNRLSVPAQFAKSTAYVGAGTGATVGLSTPLPEGGAYRVEFSDGFKSPQANKSYGDSAYRTSRDEQHLGVYMDWSPYNDNWFVTGGLTLNNHRIKVQSIAGSTLVISGSAVTASANTLNIDYKLPAITPYVGVRYVHKAYNDKGWEGFGELGLLLGKLNATAVTTLSDTAGVQAEMDRIRKSIYRWSVVPKAIIGLSYKY